MIRRGFWLAVGAVLGVTGYRRVTRLTSALTIPRRSQPARIVSAARFVRDVRDGMAEYRDLHRGEPGPARQGRTLEGQGYQAAGVSERGSRES